MDFLQQLINFSRKYPLMRTEDYIKLLFQSRFFGGHFIINSNDALLRLKTEIASCSATDHTPFLQEKPSDDFVRMSRVNLRPFVREGKNPETLNRLFVFSSQINDATKQELIEELSAFLELVKQNKIGLPFFTAKRTVAEYIKMGCPVLSHSPTYRLNYSPAYRVVRKDLWFLFDAIETIEYLLSTNLTVMVAIDGNSCAGKSFFAKSLGEYFNANVISVDDFFLPHDQRTEATESLVGGNIDWEKLQKILSQAKKGQSFDFEKYNCTDGSFTLKQYKPSMLNIVEGTFSLSSRVLDMYDFAIVLSVGKGEQKRRLVKRENKQMQKMFLEKWLPAEAKHLSVLDTKNVLTLRLSTDFYDFEGC